MAVANALAYYYMATTRAVKSFIVQASWGTIVLSFLSLAYAVTKNTWYWRHYHQLLTVDWYWSRLCQSVPMVCLTNVYQCHQFIISNCQLLMENWYCTLLCPSVPLLDVTSCQNPLQLACINACINELLKITSVQSPWLSGSIGN